MDTVMKYLFYLCVALLFSCGTSKRSTAVERNGVTNAVISDSLLRRESLSSLERLLSNERLQAHLLVTEWSFPDSTGKQYPVRTTEAHIGMDKTEQAVKSGQAGTDTRQINKKEIARTETDSRKEHVDTDTRPLPAWTWWLLVLCLAIFITYKHYQS